MEIQSIHQSVHVIRGQKVLLDSDLAQLYGVETKALNLAVKRNIERFPEDFMFTLTESEWKNLRLQNETSSYGGRRYLPNVFTEQGIAMLSGVLKSERAVQVNIAIMRMFVELRRYSFNYSDLSSRMDELEGNVEEVRHVILEIMRPDVREVRRIGY